MRSQAFNVFISMNEKINHMPDPDETDNGRRGELEIEDRPEVAVERGQCAFVTWVDIVAVNIRLPSFVGLLIRLLFPG
jgi:hypothetical protein